MAKQKNWYNEKLAADSPDSRNQIQRYIRLANLIPDILKLVDDGRTAPTPAVELSYLNSHEQSVLYYKFIWYLALDSTRYHPNYTADIRKGVAVEYVSCEPSENLKELFPEEYGYDGDVLKKEETEQA